MVGKTDMRWLQQLKDDIARQQTAQESEADQMHVDIERAERHAKRALELVKEGRRFSLDCRAGVIRFRDGTTEQLAP